MNMVQPMGVNQITTVPMGANVINTINTTHYNPVRSQTNI